jgi:hypothetical protein
LGVVLLAGAVVVVLVVGAVALGSTLRARSDDRARGAGGMSVGLAVGAVLVLVVLVSVAVGVRGSDSDSGADAGNAEVSRAAAARPPTALEEATGVREVQVHASDDDEFTAPVVLDDLDSRVVLRVYAIGFEPDTYGVVEQCVVPGTRASAAYDQCGNRFPVRFDPNGNARFQYLVGDSYLDPGDTPTCAARGAACVVRITDDNATAFVHTVFGTTTDRARVRVSPSPEDIASGHRVTVVLDGFAPGARADFALCAAPATGGTARCRALGSPSGVTLDADGSARVRLALRDQPVGSERVECGRQVPCALVVRSGEAAAPVAPLEVSFSGGPGASYDSGRVAFGIALAILLLVVAAWFVRATDWRKPSEAETPEMDAAVLVDEL